MIEDTNGQKYTGSIWTRLLRENIIFIGTPIEDNVANIVCASLLHLEAENPDRDIQIYLNSPGGYRHSTFAIYDTMQYVSPDISTICFGQTRESATLLLAAGAKGKRFALPHSKLQLRQPAGGSERRKQITDLLTEAAEIERDRGWLEEALANHTGHDVAKVHADIERERWLSAEDALEYGILDAVLSHRQLATISDSIRPV